MTKTTAKGGRAAAAPGTVIDYAPSIESDKIVTISPRHELYIGGHPDTHAYANGDAYPDTHAYANADEHASVDPGGSGQCRCAESLGLWVSQTGRRRQRHLQTECCRRLVPYAAGEQHLHCKLVII